MTARLPALFLALVTLAAAAPLVETSPAPKAQAAFPGWPERYEGRPLTPLPPAPEDRWLAGQFPGRIARFTDGERQIVLRWVAGPTRLLHPAQQCFRGAGYAIEPGPVRRAADGATMSCFTAGKPGATLDVCERVHDGRGGSWPDVSAWYWSAVFARSSSGYWSVLEVRRTPVRVS